MRERISSILGRMTVRMMEVSSPSGLTSLTVLRSGLSAGRRMASNEDGETKEYVMISL